MLHLYQSMSLEMNTRAGDEKYWLPICIETMEFVDVNLILSKN